MFPAGLIPAGVDAGDCRIFFLFSSLKILALEFAVIPPIL